MNEDDRLASALIEEGDVDTIVPEALHRSPRRRRSQRAGTAADARRKRSSARRALLRSQ